VCVCVCVCVCVWSVLASFVVILGVLHTACTPADQLYSGSISTNSGVRVWLLLRF
jgi:hypothetical protein